MTKRHRQPRPPATGLPVTFAKAEIAAQETEIIRYITVMRTALGNHLSFENSRQLFEDHFFEMLVGFDPTKLDEDVLAPEDIVHLARAKHPAADRAIFRFVDKAMVVDRFQELPMPIREYFRERAAHGPMSPIYPPRTPQVVAHFIRDVWIALVMERLVRRLPGWPRYTKKKGRRSAAALVGEVFHLGEAQIRRIHEADRGLAVRVGMFYMRGYFESFDPPLNV